MLFSLQFPDMITTMEDYFYQAGIPRPTFGPESRSSSKTSSVRSSARSSPRSSVGSAR